MFHAIARQLVDVVNREELVRQLFCKRAGQRFANRRNGDRVDYRKQLGDFIGGRQRQNFSRQRRIDLLIQQNRTERIGDVNRQRQRLALLMAVDVQLDVGCQQALRGIPAGEVVARVAHQEGELLVAPFIFQLHRGGKLTQQRRYRLEVDVVEHKSLLALGHIQHVMHRMAPFLQRDHLPFVIIQFDIERNVQRLFLRLFRGRRRTLADGQRILLGFRIVVVMDAHHRRAGLAVPTTEMRQVDVRGILHRLDKIVAGGGAAVVALEVQLHPFLEILFAQQRMEHADHFGALLIHRQGIEVIHLDNAIRAYRMGHRAGILSELQTAHGAHVVNPVHRARTEIGAELLIAEHGQPFFQAQLEPVAAGHAVTGPVMEVFVADDAFNIEIIFIGCGIGAGQYVFGVKDV